jgi:hypothetical protein
MATSEGKYSSNLTDCVTERKKLDAGIYVVVPATFNQMQMGKFELTFYTSMLAGFEIVRY